MWWQLQRAKKSKSTEVILLMKSPAEDTSVYAAFINNGNMTHLFRCRSSNLYELIDDINDESLHTLIHVDVSLGD